MSKKWLFLTIMLLTTNVLASTYDIQFHQEGTKILIKEIISSDKSEEFNITLTSDARSISTSTNYTVNDNILTISGKNINISYITNNLIDKSGNNYYFSYRIMPKPSDARITAGLFLNEGFVVDNEEIYPDGEVLTDGRQISIRWKFDESKNVPVFVKIEEINNTPAWLYTIIVLIALIILIYVTKLFINYGKKVEVNKKKKAGSIKKKDSEDFTKYLFENEASVVNELRKAKRREMWQKDIQKNTGFSKAKLSRIIRNLEAKSLIEKTPYGNTNKIRLKKK